MSGFTVRNVAPQKSTELLVDLSKFYDFSNAKNQLSQLSIEILAEEIANFIEKNISKEARESAAVVALASSLYETIKNSIDALNEKYKTKQIPAHEKVVTISVAVDNNKISAAYTDRAGGFPEKFFKRLAPQKEIGEKIAYPDTNFLPMQPADSNVEQSQNAIDTKLSDKKDQANQLGGKGLGLRMAAMVVQGGKGDLQLNNYKSHFYGEDIKGARLEFTSNLDKAPFNFSDIQRINAQFPESKGLITLNDVIKALSKALEATFAPVLTLIRKKKPADPDPAKVANIENTTEPPKP